ncbi:MAG: hypothetical protein E7338_02285 [Clostridiales bacterium]|nr:hypothetical protein [Clostridiales bacterium]
MKLDKEIFAKCKVYFDKLVPYGFIESNDGAFSFRKDILNGDFVIHVDIDANGNIICKIIEVAFNEEFKGLDIEDYVGSFIGEMKDECERVLLDIKDKCCYVEPFRFDQSNRITKELFKLYNEAPDYPFDDGKNDEDAVFRCKDNQKWYGILMPIKRSCISKNKEDEDIIDVLNVKVDENKLEDILKLPSVYPAYHMNKQKWISIVLDGGLDDKTLMNLICTSRDLVIAKHKKK